MKVNGIETDIESEMFIEERRPYIPDTIAAWNRATAAFEPMPDSMDEDDRPIAFFMFAGGYYTAKTEG